ncbi:hypothetical protein [Iningainema tapete]|uniref:Uncharacterized protein n=1 Tax=Iningainema tapete BLCC-T55 TaxID=2748662 RepID=A0A8J6XU38_9CYAN|nr:hypothetical protein [Iningainema tapete]MBD2777651.1 hypothetical protein [Iningainema tapete BLCC-T55]
MLITYELRWFYPGSVPEDIKLWFEQNCLANSQQQAEERSDVYLFSPECDFLGIKLRQGRLEVKWRTKELGVVSFSEFVEGKVEKWGKWLCCDSTEESFQPSQVLGNPTWIKVDKIRSSQLYQVLPNSLPQPVSADEDIKNGCSVELTNLMIRENHWWSLAFEARGEDDRLMDNLLTTTKLVFNNYCGFKLLALNSYAYPTWLTRLEINF